MNILLMNLPKNLKTQQVMSAARGLVACNRSVGSIIQNPNLLHKPFSIDKIAKTTSSPPKQLHLYLQYFLYEPP